MNRAGPKGSGEQKRHSASTRWPAEGGEDTERTLAADHAGRKGRRRQPERTRTPAGLERPGDRARDELERGENSAGRAAPAPFAGEPRYLCTLYLGRAGFACGWLLSCSMQYWMP